METFQLDAPCGERLACSGLRGQIALPHAWHRHCDFERGSKRMFRKKGGQPGNRSAVTHGRYSAETRAKRIAVAAKRRTAADEWLAKIPTWYWHATCAAIKAHGGVES